MPPSQIPTRKQLKRVTAAEIHREMLVCRILGVLMACTSVVLLLLSLITDYWLVAYGVKDTVHSGLWQECRDGGCYTPTGVFGYIIATRAFLILAALIALVTVLSLTASFTSFVHATASGSFVACIAAFTAGLCTLIAVAVFTAESWGKNKDPQIQLTFQWSFYLGWIAFPMLLLTGLFSLATHVCSPRSSYESM